MGSDHIQGRLSTLTGWSFQSVMTTSVTGYVRDMTLLLYQPDSRFGWERQTLSLRDGFARAEFRRIGEKTFLVEGHLF